MKVDPESDRESSKWEGRRRSGLGLLTLLVFGFASFVTRILPLSISRYPYNNDGITECNLAQNILSTGSLNIRPDGLLNSTHSTAIPSLNILLAYVSSAIGVNPYECAQIVIGFVSILTIGSLFLLGKRMTGDYRGGAIASFLAVMLGTFLFTTGSVWKEALGMALLVTLMVCFVYRYEVRFRLLSLSLLLVLPFVHHLVAFVALLLIAYLVSWGWYFGLRNGTLQRRHFFDMILLVVPAILTVAAYSYVSFDRLSAYSALGSVGLIVLAFGMLALLQIAVLSIKNHSKISFAPFVGLAVLTCLILDYYGFFFDYKPATSFLFLIPAVSFGILVSFGWRGTEYALEHLPRHRAVQLALLLAPTTLIGFSLLSGLTSNSQQIVYRSFDFVDPFIFIGVATAMTAVYAGRRRIRRTALVAILFASLISFPFGYYTQPLLEVRHDTQAYEVDAMVWIGSSQGKQLLSDERLSYIGQAITGIPKDNGISHFFRYNESTRLPDGFIIVTEDSITSVGVNDFPNGLFTASETDYAWVTQSSSVLYLGGPIRDRLVVFSLSSLGQRVQCG